MRKWLVGVLFPAALVATGPPAAAAGDAAPVRIFSSLSCHQGGGADLTLTVRNLGSEALRIDQDFHVFLSRVRPGRPELLSILFVFPAPTHQVVPPHDQVTFLLQAGVGEEGEEGLDLRARRLFLDVEFFFEHRDRPVERHFSYPGCSR